jgi:hypothetical protein
LNRTVAKLMPTSQFASAPPSVVTLTSR